MNTYIVLAGAFMALALHTAAAQCPTAECKAAWEGVDCCKYDYSNSKGNCFWGSTPVSFERTRTCTQGGATYNVLRKGNFQGPPGREPECRCRDPGTGSSSGSGTGAGAGQQQQFSALQVCTTLKPRVGMDIAGSDVSCAGNSFCKVCGTPESVKNACMANNKCLAFSYDSTANCGYLKSSSTTSQRTGWVAFTRD